jgi:hypothetical protein
MKNTLAQLRPPLIVSALLVMPLISMELFNRRTLREDFPFPLFGMLWLLAMAFLLILTPMVRDVRAGNPLTSTPSGLLFRVVFLAAIAFVWGSILLDQWPCFVGVPNCD